MIGLAFAGLGALVAVALCAAARAFRGVDPDTVDRTRPARSQGWKAWAAGQFNRLGLRVATAIALLVLATVATGWPVLMLLAVVGGFLAPSQLGAAGRRRAHAARLDAIATWTEQVRDLMSGYAGLEEAIKYSAPVAPLPIRTDVDWLAGVLEGGMSPRTALRRFADRLDDPVGDKVVAAMILAFEGSVGSMVGLLSRLADSIRAEVRMRMRVDTSRAANRTAVRVMVTFTVVVVGGMITFNRAYVEAYRTVIGQLVLVVVAVMFATAFWWLARAARPVKPARFMVAGSAPSHVGHHDDVQASRRVAWTEGPTR